MGKIEFLEREKLEVYKWVGPRYYDHPDGEDLPGKLKFASIVASSAGLIIGGFVSGVKPAPINFVERLTRTVRCIVPCFGVAVTFTMVTYYSTRIRGKDDEINHFFGGLLSGATLGALCPLKDWGVYGAITFPILAAFNKYLTLRGERLFPEHFYRNLPSYYLRNIDSSLTPETPTTWSKERKNQKEKTIVCTEI